MLGLCIRRFGAVFDFLGGFKCGMAVFLQRLGAYRAVAYRGLLGST